MSWIGLSRNAGVPQHCFLEKFHIFLKDYIFHKITWLQRQFNCKKNLTGKQEIIWIS